MPIGSEEFQHVLNNFTKCGDCAAVSFVMVMWTYMGDVNSALGRNSKEPSSSTISREASFNGDNNEETLNINKVCQQL